MNVRVLVAAALAFALGGAGLSARPPMQVYFGPTEEGLGIAEHFLEFVDGADETLDLAFYEFRYDPIVSAVLDAHDRGVRVRVLVDDDNYFLQDEEGKRLEGTRNPFVQRLEAGGIDVRHDDRSGLMHNKFAVRDGEHTWTGSFNLTDTGTEVNANNAVKVRSRQLASVYTAEFEEMYVDGLFGITSPRQEGQDLEFEGARLEVLFGPEDDPNARICELLQGAKEQVYFMQFAFTASDISDVLVERKQAEPHLDIRGIFDRLLHRSTGPYGEFAKLTDNGIPVVIDNRDEGKLHHKVFLIDPEGEDPVVVLGSANASANANQANDENLLVIHDREVAARFHAEFQSLYGKVAQARAEVFLRGLALAGQRLPDADLVITSGGQALTGIRLEMPARWKPEEHPRVLVHRNGDNVTREVGLVVTHNRYIEIKKPMLARFGRDAYLVIKFLGLRLPEIHGAYSMYVEVRDRMGNWRPLERQPSFRVLGELTPETLGVLMDHLARLNRRLGALRRVTHTAREHLEKHLDATFRQLAGVIAETVAADDLTIARAAVDFLEQMPPGELAELLERTEDERQLSQALGAAAVRGVEGARELAARLQAIL